MHVGDWLVLLAPKEEIQVLILNGRTTLLETRWPPISASAAERQGQSRLACTGARLLSTDKLAPLSARHAPPMLLLMAHPISQWAYRVSLSGVVSRCTRCVTHYASLGRHAKAVFRYAPAHGPRCRAQLRVLEPRQTAQRTETVKGRGALADAPVS